jgi:hypothetical protein
MPAVFHTIHSRTKKEKRTKKERISCYYYPLKLLFNSIGVTIRGLGVRGIFYTRFEELSDETP